MSVIFSILGIVITVMIYIYNKKDNYRESSLLIINQLSLKLLCLQNVVKENNLGKNICIDIKSFINENSTTVEFKRIKTNLRKTINNLPSSIDNTIDAFNSLKKDLIKFNIRCQTEKNKIGSGNGISIIDLCINGIPDEPVQDLNFIGSSNGHWQNRACSEDEINKIYNECITFYSRQDYISQKKELLDLIENLIDQIVNY